MKSKRQQTVLEVIKNEIILTQEELQSALIRHGYKVTQSTVSRDIKELRLIKGHDGNGNYRYIAPERNALDKRPVSHYRDIFAKSVVSVDWALNNVVVKCYNGMASSVCVTIDTLFGARMLGSLAGEDTIIIVTRSAEESNSLADELKNMM